MTGGVPRNQTGESPESTGRSPESNRAIPGIKPVILFQDCHQKPTTVMFSQIRLNLTVPPKHAQFYQKTGRCHM